MSTHRRSAIRAAARALPALGLALALGACEGRAPGLEVTRCEPWGAAGRAGLATGDRLVGWRVDGRSGGLTSPLELLALEADHGPTDTVELTALRRGRRRTVRIEGSPWWLETRPAAAGALPPEGSAGGAPKGGDARALAVARRRADESEATGPPLLASWWRLEVGDLLVGAGRFDAATAAYARARELAGGPRFEAAAADWEARRLIVAWRLDEALAAERRALALRESVAPGGPAVAVSLHQLGRIEQRLQHYDQTAVLDRAAEILAPLPYGGDLLADVVNLRGSMVWGRRDLDGAEADFEQAIAILERLGRESPRRASALGNLGLIAELRGEMGRAEELFGAAAAMHERVDPGSAEAAYSYNYLGILAKQQGDLEAAQRHYERAAALFEAARPDSVETAGMLNNLGNLAFRRGEPAVAERYHRRALAVRERVAPDTADHAASLQNVGQALLLQGRLDEAEGYLVRARDIKARLIPESLDHANALTALGSLRRDQGRLDEAEALHRQALALRQSQGSGRWEWAESLFLLGEIALERGERGEAERLWREAVEGIEENRARPEWDPEERSGFAAPYHRFYRRLAELLVADGRPREAFELLEGARARALRTLLAARELRPPADLPAARIARRQALGEPRSRGLDEIAAALSEGSLLLAFSVGEEETLLFVVPGGDPGGLAVHRLPVGAGELGSRVAVFRALIERGREGGPPEPALLAQGHRLFERLLAPAEAALAAARRVVIVPDGPLLALPFAALVRGGGPPVEPGGPVDPIEWLGGWRPLSLVPSAGVLVELGEASRRAPGGRLLAAFGDPRYATGGGKDGGAAGERAGLAPLPATRDEVSRIAALYPGSLVYLGERATEERLGALPERPAILHLAVHGLLDERFPLESALAFATPAAAPERDGGGGDGGTRADGARDGLLHAWEVAERLDLDAELVVLSACDTGRGREVAGEGIVGLARAFQIAGARAVMVSQWPVADRSTAELMVRFYRHLAAGRPKAEALAAAQREMAAGRAAAGDALIDTRHPFAWAGFQIVGDGG